MNNNSTNQKETSLKSLKKYVFITLFLLVIVVVFNIYMFQNMKYMNIRYNEIQKTVEQSRLANEKVLARLEEIRDEQIKLEKHQQQILQLKADHKYTVLRLKQYGMSAYDDLGQNTNLTVEDMNAIIDYYDSIIKGGTPFKGKGEAFINASKETGLNPIYIFAHASCESGYGNSYYAVTRGNYFGINAVDANPDLAYEMGDSVESGIMEGAKWIKKNYYDKGYTSIGAMKAAGYASSPSWVPTIISIANVAINVI